MTAPRHSTARWAAVLLVALVACGERDDSQTPAEAEHRGWLYVRLAPLEQPLLDVVAVEWRATCDGGYVWEQLAMLHALGAPESATPAAAEQRFADAIFFAPPGPCAVEARPLAASGLPSARCGSASVDVNVHPDHPTLAEIRLTCLDTAETAEALLESANFPPVVTQIAYAPGSALVPCQLAEVTVHALDPEGGVVDASWSAVSVPPGAQYEVSFNGASLLFSATTPGAYTFSVALIDPAGGLAEADVELFVSPGPGGSDECPAACTVGGCEDSNPCTVDSCVEVGCVHETLSEVCDGADNDCNGIVDDQCYCERRGDLNGSGITNVADAQCAVLAVFWSLTGGTAPPPACLAASGLSAADVDCNGQINVADILVVIYFALLSKPPFAIDQNDNACADQCEPDHCGNGICEPQETCSDCPLDCGSCPATP